MSSSPLIVAVILKTALSCSGRNVNLAAPIQHAHRNLGLQKDKCQVEEAGGSRAGGHLDKEKYNTEEDVAAIPAHILKASFEYESKTAARAT